MGLFFYFSSADGVMFQAAAHNDGALRLGQIRRRQELQRRDGAPRRDGRRAARRQRRRRRRRTQRGERGRADRAEELSKAAPLKRCGNLHAAVLTTRVESHSFLVTRFCGNPFVKNLQFLCNSDSFNPYSQKFDKSTKKFNKTL